MATIMFYAIRNKQIAHLQYKIISNDLIERFLCNLDMRRFIFRYTQWIPVSIINNRRLHLLRVKEISFPINPRGNSF